MGYYLTEMINDNLYDSLQTFIETAFDNQKNIKNAVAIDVYFGESETENGISIFLEYKINDENSLFKQEKEIIDFNWKDDERLLIERIEIDLSHNFKIMEIESYFEGEIEYENLLLIDKLFEKFDENIVKFNETLELNNKPVRLKINEKTNLYHFYNKDGRDFKIVGHLPSLVWIHLDQKIKNDLLDFAEFYLV